ncbi:hypothetical protein NKG94_32960 [Micromonospora sp. M12]
MPTSADEARLWSLIESAWAELGDEPLALRRALVERDPPITTAMTLTGRPSRSTPGWAPSWSGSGSSPPS